jgi:hypothetical protein
MALRVALISCTKSKTSYPAPARVLYSESALFRKALAYAEPRADRVYVLSAKYGLVTLDQPLEPYELTLKTMGAGERKAWAARVFDQIREQLGANLGDITFEFHTGEEYREHLTALLSRAGATCTCPVEGLAIGERMQFYDQHGAHKQSPPPAAAAQERALKPSAQQNEPFALVWQRIVAHAGEPFHQIRGGEFRYQVAGQYLRLDRTNQPIPYGHLEEAHHMVPLPNTTVVQHLRAPSYIYAILMDPRIRQQSW